MNCPSFQSGKHLCSMTQSPNQLLYNLYNIIALTEIKGYAMLQFSYMMLKIYDKVNLSPRLLILDEENRTVITGKFHG